MILPPGAQPELTPAPAPGPADADLVAEVRAGRREGFEPLVRRHVPSVLGFLRYLGVPADLQDDLVQETFTRAFERLDQYEVRRPFVSWLLGIARNLFYDHCRKNSRDRREPPPPDPERVGAIEETVLGNLSVEAILHSLPADARLLVELRIFRELPFADIGATMGVSEAPLRVRFQRVMARLRQAAREVKVRES